MTPVTDRQLEQVVSRALHWGVLSSGALMLAGFLMYAIRVVTGAPDGSFAYERFHAIVLEADPWILLLHPLTYLYAGIFLLAFTPVARVVITITLFALEGDRHYVRISSLVLSVILLSIFLAFM
jgi:uncharacterized membrane protein